MLVGQAYPEVLTPHAQQALEAGCDILIDGCFEALETIKEPEDITGRATRTGEKVRRT